MQLIDGKIVIAAEAIAAATASDTDTDSAAEICARASAMLAA